MTYPPIVNYLQMIPFFFQLYTTKSFQQMNLIMTYGKLVTGTISGKQAQEVIFSRKITKTNHPKLIFNDNPVHQVALQSHLGMFLDSKLIFKNISKL